MNLSIFFQPVNPDVCPLSAPANSFFRSIAVHRDTFPNYQEADIALLGITENRGAADNPGVSEAADAVRQALYLLKKGSGAYRVADLGNLAVGHSLEETYTRVREVCGMLMASNTLPVLIGGSHDIDYGQYLAYENLDQLVNLVSVDAYIDIQPQHEQRDGDQCRNHLHYILTHEKNYLLNYSHVAYQSFLVDRQAPALLERFCFDTHRLGQVTQQLTAIEPVMRQANMLSFDVSAIKAADAPGNVRAQPFGLTGQEACQLCWYAGHSERLTSAGFFEYNPQQDDQRRTTASVIATMAWYLIEGYYHRTYEEDFAGNDFVKYMVPMSATPEHITFYKAKRSEKWWMEVPRMDIPRMDILRVDAPRMDIPRVDAPRMDIPRSGGVPPSETYMDSEEFNLSSELLQSRRRIVPCDPSDYHRAVQGDLPDRWIQAHAKYL
ncbi:MAG: formimidoylglutamase [Tunicatimonas sp.]